MTVHAFPLGWSEQLIANGLEVGDVPVYGSAAWVALLDDDRRKVAATVVAAESWRTRKYAEIEHPAGHGRRARQIAEARRPRPGDHLGGPVQWDSVSGQ